MSARADGIGQECLWKGAGRIRSAHENRWDWSTVFLGAGEIGHEHLWDWAGVSAGAGGKVYRSMQNWSRVSMRGGKIDQNSSRRGQECN